MQPGQRGGGGGSGGSATAVCGIAATAAGCTAAGCTAAGCTAAGCTAATATGVITAAASAATITGGVIGINCFTSYCAAERSATATRDAHRQLCRGRSLIHAQAPRRREQPRESGAHSLAQRAKSHDSGARRGM